MDARSRPALTDQRGFTMVELLVVILIVGILATIAVPAFMGQRTRADDTEAQQMVRTVATALATYHTDAHTYDATREQLAEIEPAVDEATGDLVIDGTALGYEITERSRSDTTFTLTWAEDGTVTRSCSTPDRGRCKSDSTW
jgi:type IV pilus assembly protein PilA